MSNTLLNTACAALFLATVTVAPAGAQTPPPAPASAPETKVIGDWGVHCFASASPSPCEMQQTATQNNTGRRVLGMSIAYAPANSRYIFQIALPLGVSLAKGVKILATGYNGVAMAYRRCDAAGCYVEGIMDVKAVDALGGASAPSKIEIASADGRVIDLPFSLRGFTEARKAMEDLARQKATKP
jgi:invasion protein IalB